MSALRMQFFGSWIFLHLQLLDAQEKVEKGVLMTHLLTLTQWKEQANPSDQHCPQTACNSAIQAMNCETASHN